MIFQDPYASLNPRWQVADIIAEPIRAHSLVAENAMRDRVNQLLEQVGMSPSDGENIRMHFPVDSGNAFDCTSVG